MPTHDEGAELQLLTQQPVRGLLPFRARLKPGGTIEGGVAHSGEEFIHCLAGVVELRVVDTEHQLHAGDTASYPDRLPHSYHNRDTEDAVLIGATIRG